MKVYKIVYLKNLKIPKKEAVLLIKKHFDILPPFHKKHWNMSTITDSRTFIDLLLIFYKLLEPIEIRLVSILKYMFEVVKVNKVPTPRYTTINLSKYTINHNA